jgi:peptidoglycan/xylan/chitin deacetylase (PgdA/CDA1 family)
MMLRKQIKAAAFYAMNALLQKKYLNDILEKQRLTILNLHRVSPQSNPFYPPLRPELFEALLAFLTRHFNVITFREIDAYKKSKKPNVILSFDDGFKDYIEYAVPIMKKYNVQSNQNIIPQCLETGEAVWDVKLLDFLNASPPSLVNEINLPGFAMKVDERNKMAYGMALINYFKHKTKTERETLFERLERTISKNPDIRYTPMMSRKELLQVSGVHEIGVHSYSHETMAMESEAFFSEDFFKCRTYFDEILKLPLDIYAFPSGRYQEYQLDFLERHGIEHILLVDESYANYMTNRHQRFTYYADSAPEVQLRALGFHL